MSAARRAATLGLLLLLAGCSGLITEPPAEPRVWTQHRATLEHLDHWTLEGKIGIRQGEERNSANLSWRQQPGHYHIYMAGPLGQGAVNIDGNAKRVVLDVSGEGRFEAETPEQLIYQQLGWHIPISPLSYWVRGLPAPEAFHTLTLDPSNRLASLEQLGWQIRYSGYHSASPTDLPRKLTLTRGPDLRVILVINQWRIGSDDL